MLHSHISQADCFAAAQGHKYDLHTQSKFYKYCIMAYIYIKIKIQSLV
jgi:hypothetical protein